MRHLNIILLLLLCSTSCHPFEEKEVENIGAISSKLNLFKKWGSIDSSCYIAGESELTSKFLDDSSLLIACKTGDDYILKILKDSSARVLLKGSDYTLISIQNSQNK